MIVFFWGHVMLIQVQDSYDLPFWPELPLLAGTQPSLQASTSGVLRTPNVLS